MRYRLSGTWALMAAYMAATASLARGRAFSRVTSSFRDLSRETIYTTPRPSVLGETMSRRGQPSRSASENMNPAETGRSS